MGYVKRYRQEAAERNLPHWNRVVIAQAGENTQEAIVARHGMSAWPPELPLTFPNYEAAFAWVERKLTSFAPDNGIHPLPEIIQADSVTVKPGDTTPAHCR